MAKGFGIHGSTTDHGGTVISTQSRSSQMGNLFLRAGDGFACPKCKCWSTLIKSNDHVIFDGKAVAYVGDKFTCGATLMPKQVHVVGTSGSGSSSSSVSNFQTTNNQLTNNFLSEKNNFDIEFSKISIKTDLFVPCGVPSYQGKKSNDKIDFEIKIKTGIFEYLKLEIETESGKYQLIKRISGPHHPGKKIKVDWDGFVNDIYDSKKFTSKDGINFRIKGYAFDKEQCSHIENARFKYSNKTWIDSLINRKTLKIAITLRVGLSDGGEQGIDSWKYIPPNQILVGKPPYRSRNVSFEQLKTMALDGMKYHWSRNSSHPVGKSILLDGKNYEVFLTAQESTVNMMPMMKLIFATNWRPTRSANWELYRSTFYNTGYMLFNTSRGAIWQFWDASKANKQFKLTFAHEMGHELLLAYSGQKYSKGHKSTSGIINQSPKAGTTYPKIGEIDLMKYADENENNINLFHERSVASQEDVAGLLFISGITK